MIGHGLDKINRLAGQAPPQVVSALKQASAKTGTDFSYLLQNANTESSFKTDAAAKTSSARGLFQFIQKTWLDLVDRFGEKHGIDVAGKSKKEILALRHDPEVSAIMAGEFTKENAEILKNKLGREPNSGELYLAHFLGVGGACKLIRAYENKPGCDAASLLPEAAHANRSVFYKNGRALDVADLYHKFSNKFIDLPGNVEAKYADASPPSEAMTISNLAWSKPLWADKAAPAQNLFEPLSFNALLDLAEMKLPGVREDSNDSWAQAKRAYSQAS